MNRELRRAQKKTLPDDVKAMAESLFQKQGIWIGVHKPNEQGLVTSVLNGDGEKAIMHHAGVPTEAKPWPLMGTGVILLDKCSKHLHSTLTSPQTSAMVKDSFTVIYVDQTHTQMIAVPDFFEHDGMVAPFYYVPPSFDWKTFYDGGDGDEFGVPKRIIDLFDIKLKGEGAQP